MNEKHARVFITDVLGKIHIGDTFTDESEAKFQAAVLNLERAFMGLGVMKYISLDVKGTKYFFHPANIVHIYVKVYNDEAEARQDDPSTAPWRFVGR